MDIKDAYIAMTGTQVGQVLVGNSKVPFSLVSETSSKYMTFVERPLPLSVNDPKREVGIYISDKVMDRRLSYKVGAFRDSVNGFSTGRGGLGYGGRLGSLPLVDDNTSLFLGVSAWAMDPEGVKISPHPELHMVPSLVGDSMDVDKALVYTLESGFSCGPAHAAAEYIAADLSASGVGEDATVRGFYVQAGVFLTGEHRQIDSVAWKRLKPKSNFSMGDARGAGAWELKARYSTIDLDDGGFAGGKEDNITLGANWYLNPHTAVKFDYVFADASDVSGNGGVVRFQVDF